MKIKESNIYLTRGDNANLTLDIQFDEQFEIKKIFFTIKKSAESSVPVLQKKWIREGVSQEVNLEDGIIKPDPESDIFVVEFENEDTRDIKFGLYRYDIQVNYVDSDDESDERVLTVVKPSIFAIEEEITLQGVST